MEIAGVVVDGSGGAAMRMDCDMFTEWLGGPAYAGTLNVQVGVEARTELRNHPGVFDLVNGTKHLPVTATIRQENGGTVRMSCLARFTRDHTVVELISTHRLRDFNPTRIEILA